MTSFWPQNCTFSEFWTFFADISLLLIYNMEITPIKSQLRLFIILKTIFWNSFSKIFYHFGPMTSLWPPKQHFVSILDKFWQISAFYSTITWKLLKQTMVDNIVYYTQVIILKQFSQKFSSILDLWRHFDPQNSTFYADFSLLLNYNMEIIPYNYGGDCS